MRKLYALDHQATRLSLMLVALSGISTSAQSQSIGDPWSLTLSVREAREFDRQIGGVLAVDRVIRSANASIGYSARTERSNYGFFGRIGGNLEDDEFFQDQLTYGAGFSWNYRVSSLTQMSLRQSVNKNLRLETLANLGVVPTDLSTLSASTQWSLQSQSSARTSWSAGLGYNFTEFSNFRPIAGSQIVLDEQPFGSGIGIPLINPSDPAQVDLPDGENDILRILATEGLADPNARSHDAVATFGLNHSVSRRTSLGFNVSGNYRSIATSQTQDGPVGTAQMFVQRSVTNASAMSVGYTFQRSFVIDPNTTIQTLFTGWTYSPEASSASVSLFGGVSRFQAEGLNATTQPAANVALTGKITRTTTAHANYSRQFSMPLGFGRSLLIDYLDAGISQAIGTRVNASANVGASLGTDTLDDDSKLDTLRAGVAVTVRVVGGLTFGTSYFYVENEQRTSVSSFEDTYTNLSFYLTYGTHW